MSWDGEHSPEYEAYMRSDRWLIRRDRFFKMIERICVACRSDDQIDLHHLTYARLGHERADDLVPLCRDCHDRVHAVYQGARNAPGYRRANGFTLERATIVFILLKVGARKRLGGVQV